MGKSAAVELLVNDTESTRQPSHFALQCGYS